MDIIIGTHTLVYGKAEFKDLGLLVIDEEQRFGVAQKEKLKQLAAGVDVLMLSATPIPRTLNMAIGGIRDMSILDEPPGDRRPVQTYVLEYDAIIIEGGFKDLFQNIKKGKVTDISDKKGKYDEYTTAGAVESICYFLNKN